MRLLVTLIFLPFSFVVCNAANAAPTVFFDDVAGGRTSFDTQIAAASGTIFTDTLTGLINNTNSWARTGYTITSTDATNRTIHTTYLAGGAPATYTGGGESIRLTTNGTTTSGLTFTFATPVNGFGIELGDWATCCMPSAIYMSFDGGTPILVGSASVSSDNPGVGAGDGPRTFVAAIDDSATFSTITFYGNANGDILYAGGIIRYASVPIGAISGNYKITAAPTIATGLANYLDLHDSGGGLLTVANFLNGASEAVVVQSLKEIFPVNTSATSQAMTGAMGQTTSVLIDKVGTVLGSIENTVPKNNGTQNSFMALNTWLFNETSNAQSVSKSVSNYEGGAIAALSSVPYREFRNNDMAFWVEGVGGITRGNEDDLSAAYNSTSRGVVAGYEYAINDNNLIGVLGSVFDTDLEIDNNAGNVTANNWTVGLYGQHIINANKISLIGLFGYGDYDAERVVSVAGVNGIPQSNYNSISGSATAMLSHLYEYKKLQMEPFLLTNYTAVKSDGYTEANGGVYNMTVSGDRFSTASVKTGFNLVYKELNLFNYMPLYLRFKPYVGYKFQIENAENFFRFAGTSPTSGVAISGRNITGIDGGLGVEAKLQLSENQTAKLGIDISKDKNEDRFIFYLGYGFKF